MTSLERRVHVKYISLESMTLLTVVKEYFNVFFDLE